MRIYLFFILAFSISSCKQEFEPIDYGHEACASCKMMIVDRRYSAEMITEKGKVFKFDDLSCLKSYLNENKLSFDNKMLFIADFKNNSSLYIDAKKAIYLNHDYFKSPMNGNCAAFSSITDAQNLKDSLGIVFLSWGSLK